MFVVDLTTRWDGS